MKTLFIMHHWRYSEHLCHLWFQFRENTVVGYTRVMRGFIWGIQCWL